MRSTRKLQENLIQLRVGTYTMHELREEKEEVCESENKKLVAVIVGKVNSLVSKLK